MRGISLRALVALAACMGLVMVCAIPAEAAYSYNFGSRKLAAGQYFEVKAFIAKEDAGMSYNVTKFYGPDFDVLLMDKANFDVYKSGSNAFSYLGASRLNTDFAYADTGIGGLTTGTEYHLVIDNTDRPAGGAVPEGQEVQVFFEFGAANIDPMVDNGLILIFVIVVAVAVVVVVVLFLFMRSRGKRAAVQQQMQYAPPYQQPNQPPVPPQQPGMKTCPQCGGQATMEYTFCPRCGFKY